MRCELPADAVFDIVCQHATAMPLSTSEIVEICEARHPGVHGISTHTINQILWGMHRQDRVQTWSGADSELKILGVRFPHARHRYWRRTPASHAARSAASCPDDH